MVNNINAECIASYVIYREIKNILKVASFPICVIKGKVLSMQAYNNSMERQSGDVDILIPRNRIKDIEKILSLHKYVTKEISRSEKILCLSSSHQIPPYRKNISGINIEIDINFDIFWGEYSGKRIDMNKFLEDVVEVEVYNYPIKALPPVKALIQLVLHHYKEMNSIYHLAGHNSINYNMFKDVYNLWKNNKNDISLEKLYLIAEDYEIVPFVFYILYFTNCLFKDMELKKYVDAFRTLEGENLLEYYGLAENERKLWKVNFFTRLETENMFELIKNDLTESDFTKLKLNQKLFG